MLYSALKTQAQTLYGNYIGKGFVEPDTGSPTELATYFDLVHTQIASYPHEWPFLKITGTLTLTGASSYDLSTEFPDLGTVFQVYGISSNQEHEYFANDIANLTPLDGWTMKGKTLIFTGNSPTGTATIQYKSQYLVEDSSGSRQQYFSNDDDVSVLGAAHIGVLLFGIGEFVQWKADTKSKYRRDLISGKFDQAWSNLLDENEMSNQIGEMI